MAKSAASQQSVFRKVVAICLAVLIIIIGCILPYSADAIAGHASITSVKCAETDTLPLAVLLGIVEDPEKTWDLDLSARDYSQFIRGFAMGMPDVREHCKSPSLLDGFELEDLQCRKREPTLDDQVIRSIKRHMRALEHDSYPPYWGADPHRLNQALWAW